MREVYNTRRAALVKPTLLLADEKLHGGRPVLLNVRQQGRLGLEPLGEHQSCQVELVVRRSTLLGNQALALPLLTPQPPSLGNERLLRQRVQIHGVPVAGPHVGLRVNLGLAR
jgi:hypothetical protein